MLCMAHCLELAVRDAFKVTCDSWHQEIFASSYKQFVFQQRNSYVAEINTKI